MSATLRSVGLIGMALLVVALAALAGRVASVSAQTATVSAVTVASSARTTATATATVSGMGTFYLRLSLHDEDDWGALLWTAAATEAGDVTFSLTALAANAYYDVEVSADSTFATGVESSTFQNRPAHLDITLAGSDLPTGIAGDANTLWVISDGFSLGVSTTILAYKRTLAAQHGDRDTAKDITPGLGNHSPGGLWSDGTYLYAVDRSQFRAYAYQLSDGSRQSSREFRLARGHSDAKGIWANSDTFWVVYPQHDAYAYERPYGGRDTAKDITLHKDGSYALSGIWSDGQTMWAVDGRDRMLYALDLGVGIPLPHLNIPLNTAHANAVDSLGASDMWGDGEYLWILDGRRSGSKVFAYYQPKPDPSVSALSLVSATQTAATIRADISYPNPSKTVYLRYRAPFTAAWSTTNATGGQTIDFTLSGARSAPRLVVQASLDSTFADGTEVTAELLVRPAQRDLALVGVGQMRGIGTDGATLWVVYDRATGGSDRVDAYNLGNKGYVSSKSFVLEGENAAPRGVHVSSGTLWVVDEQDDKVYAYSLSGTPFGRLDTAKSFEIAPENGHPRGMWSDGATMWIAGHVREHVFAYNIGSTGTFGARDTTKEGDLATSYTQPRGMWSNGSALWVADGALDRVFAYALGTAGVGDRQPPREIQLARENGAPWGVTSSGNTLWVGDEAKVKIYAYNLPAAPSGNITGVEFGETGRTTASVTVTIANPGSTEQTVALKYRAQPDGDDQLTSKMTSSTSVTFDLTGLTADTLYALLVTLGTDVTLRTPGFKTQSEREQRGHFLKTGVVSVHETANPWVRELYDDMRRLNTPMGATDSDSRVVLDCSTRRIGTLVACEVTRVDIGNSAASDTGVYLHELGHVYNAGARLMGRDSEGRGIAWLYFADLVAGGTGCQIHEIYADAVESGTVASSLSTYFPPCSRTGDTPSATTLTMINSVLAKTMPAWFDTTYEDDTVPYDTSTDDKYDKKYDLEEVWTDVKGVGSWKHVAAYALRNAFGAYCDRQRATEALYGRAPTRNPWRAGGCVPQAPAAVVLAADGRVTWEKPSYDGGEAITAYLVEWKGADQEYDDTRSAKITDVSGTLAHQTTATAPGSSVRVSAQNYNNIGETAEQMQPPVVPGVPGVSSVTAGDGELAVQWSAPASNGGAAITSYDVHSIRTDATDKADANWDEVIAWTSGDLEYTIAGLTNGVSYDVEVRAVNSAGDGEWSTTSTGTPLSADNTLSALSLSEGRLSLSFDSEVTSYTASVGYTVTGITVTASENDAGAETTLVSPVDTDTSVDGYQVNLSVGPNVITIRVTAADGSTRTYTVTVTRTREDTSLTPPASDPAAPFPSTATYDVEFEGKWTTAATPDGLPVGAHFSRLVGAVHNAGVSFLASGGTASAGVESMAEIGAIGTLRSEVQTAIDASPATALSLFQGSTDTGGVMAAQSLSPTLSTAHPRVTLVTMVAPSPDWFVGVSGLRLLNSSGRWLRSHTVNLYPWDAGTEEGTGFSLNNAATDPQGVITSIRGTGKFSTEPIATLSFALQSVSTTRTVEENTSRNRNMGPPIAAVATDDPVNYTLGGAGASSFAIVATSGQLRTEAALNYEARDSYEVDVTATDANGSAVTRVTVDVTNVGEPGRLVRSSPQPQVEAAFTVTLTDPDIVQSTTWTWERSTRSGGGWQLVSGATAKSYTPVVGDIGYYLRATATYRDGYSPDTDISISAVSENPVQARPPVNSAPEFPPGPTTRSVPEDAGANATVGTPVVADDAENASQLTYTLTGGSDLFTIDGSSGQIRVRTRETLDHETAPSHTVTVTATDPATAFDTVEVTIEVTDVNERPDASADDATTFEDTAVIIRVLDNDSDPEDDRSELLVTVVSPPRFGRATVNEPTFVGPERTITYEPNDDYDKRDMFTYRLSDGTLTHDGLVTVTITPVNDAPTFASPTATRRVSASAEAGANVGAPVAATDVDDDLLTYRLGGTGAASFTIDEFTGQISVSDQASFNAGDIYMVMVFANDPDNRLVRVEVTITVTAGPVGPPIIVTGGGGGGPSGPSPSEVDFEWTVTRDIEALDGGNDWPTGLWSDGAVLWIAENGPGADDELYAYDLATGERVEGREFALHETNRAPRGFWSDGATVWVSDSGQDRLFAYDLATGERVEAREFEFARRNRDARGIWSYRSTLWVLDGGKNSLFAYDLESGELLGEYELDAANDDPHGLWSDDTTVWVSNHDPKRLFAYRLPTPEGTAAGDAGAIPLMRVRGEEFTELNQAGNNSPRGLWSDGAVMYVADASDDRVYTYNMPDAIDARLASLSLSGIDIGEFSPGRTGYEGVTGEGVTETTIEAEVVQPGATIDVEPADADEAAEGRQAALDGLDEITVTVTSADRSRTKLYRVALGDAAEQETAHICLSGAIAVGFSLVVSGGGSVEALEACAESRNVTALYTLVGGEYVSHILGAPGFVNDRFGELYAGGVPARTPLVARSDGPATAAAVASAVTGPWAACLQGEIVEGFNLVVYEGGSVGALEACAEEAGVAALYALDDGVWVSYILGAPGFVNHAFGELFTDGLPAATPLVGKRD